MAVITQNDPELDTARGGGKTYADTRSREMMLKHRIDMHFGLALCFHVVQWSVF